MKRHLLLLLGLVACTPGVQPPPQALGAAPEKPNASATASLPNLVGTVLRVPDTAINIILDEDFWQGALLPFEGLVNDRGTLRRVAEGLSVRQNRRDYVLLPIEVRRVSGAGGLYLVSLERQGTHFEMRGSAFLGQGVRLLRLAYTDGILTTTTADARLGRPSATVMQPGSLHRFRLERGELLELDCAGLHKSPWVNSHGSPRKQEKSFYSQNKNALECSRTIRGCRKVPHA